MKTLWEKEKMLVTSIFSFFHNVSYPFIHNQISIFEPHLFSLCKCFNLDKSKILSFGKGFNFCCIQSHIQRIPRRKRLYKTFGKEEMLVNELKCSPFPPSFFYCFMANLSVKSVKHMKSFKAIMVKQK